MMTTLVTGSSGHLGEALMRVLRASGREAIGLDVIAGPFTDEVGSIADRECVARIMRDADTVLHAATLHKPHVATHGREAFVETNVRGTLILLEEATRARVRAFVFTSTTSAFGDALKPPPGEPAAWIDESVAPAPKNIYGVTKTAAEDLCRLFHRNEGLACIVLEDFALLSRKPTTIPRPAGLTRTTMRRPMNICSGASPSRTSSRRISTPPSARPRSASASILSARRRRSGRRIAPCCAWTRPQSSACARRDGRMNTPDAAGGCFRASIAFMTTL